jgi:uncharacterized membrane protein
MSRTSLVPGGTGTQPPAPVQPRERPDRVAHRFPRDSLEFGRVVNLSDAVFAIALTLLVLTLDAPDVGALLTFALSFFLVASVWWHHHRIFARLGWLEPGLIAVNLGMLAGVVLVPYPTSMIGAAPGSRAAVLPFIGLFALLSLLLVALILRANKLGAWRRPLPLSLFRWVVTDWMATVSIHIVGLAIAVWAPLVALVWVAGGSSVSGLTVTRIGPSERRTWF